MEKPCLLRHWQSASCRRPISKSTGGHQSPFSSRAWSTNTLAVQGFSRYSNAVYHQSRSKAIHTTTNQVAQAIPSYIACVGIVNQIVDLIVATQPALGRMCNEMSPCSSQQIAITSCEASVITGTVYTRNPMAGSPYQTLSRIQDLSPAGYSIQASPVSGRSCNEQSNDSPSG